MKPSLVNITAAASERGWTVASSFRARLLGWMGRRALAPGEGLCLVPCRSIHTFGMRIPIDVLFIDRSLRIVRCVTALRPGRIAMDRNAAAVIELPAGNAAALGLVAGTTLTRERGSLDEGVMKCLEAGR